MRIVFMGTPGFAVTPLEQLGDNGYRVVAVYTQPDRAAGRGRSLVAPPLKKAALARGLPVKQPASMKRGPVAEELAGLRPDVIVVAAFGQILPRPVLNIPPLGCVNIHPSLLPRYRGTAPVPGAILNGDTFTGVSIMLMDPGMDTGPVLSRAQIPVAPADTTGSLMSRLSLVGAQTLLDVLPRLARGEIVPQPQDESRATYTSLISKDAGGIDWKLPAVDIARRVRAFQPWPGCYTTWQGRQLKVLEAVHPAGETGTPEEDSREAGRVVALKGRAAAFGVITGDGILGVVRVQMEGKRVMSAADFLHGQRDFIGAVLPSA
ncbi:MAG: methionyl-tRNA formyltransferase [Dehalococcoidales bacterium]|nr:methionyl-tRNA formyltransferase [Dehalococcoidales bacterium]